MAIDPAVAGRAYPPLSYEVAREKIREFAEAIGDHNPVYFDPDAARDHGHKDVVAPPTFVIIPVMRGFTHLMDDLGIEFERVVHVDQRFVYERAVVVGDRLETFTNLDAVRQVAGNDLLTVRTEVRTAEGAQVCTALATLLVRPEEAANA